MDSAHHLQWTQVQTHHEFGVAKSMGEGGGSGACTMARPPQVVERKLVRPQKDQVTNCPRCQSTNTKFCYYNNYSLTQPRYFCKTCRRYWTEGGTLRNVPVGGGSRKNKKPSTTSSSCNNNSPSSSMVTMPPQLRIPDLNPPGNISLFSSQNPKIHDHDQGHDLNLGYNQQDYHLHGNSNNNNNISQFLDFPKIDSSSSSALNFLRSGINNNGVRGFNSFIPMAPGTLEANSLFASSGFPFQECKQQSSLAFSNLYGNPNNQDQTASQENINGSLMFTLGSTTIKQHSSSTSTEADHDQEKGHDQINNANGFWNGMLGGGGSW
ncbi:hypothetical protein ABFS83_02G177100 [Erythranthe nasuta]